MVGKCPEIVWIFLEKFQVMGFLENTHNTEIWESTK